MGKGPENELRNQPWRVALTYALVGTFWILGSDWLVEVLLPEGAWSTAQAYKGVGFVSVTALALLWALSRYHHKVEVVHRKLENGAERYRQFFEQSVAGVFELNASGNLIAENPAFKAMLGIGDSTGRVTLGALMEDGEAWGQLWDAVCEGRDPPAILAFFRTEQGLRRRCELRLFGIREEGALIGARGFLIDHTTLLELQEAMTQRERLDAVGRLAGGVAHDFNNILTAIMGYAEWLEATATDSQAAEGVQGLKRAAEKAGVITRQLLMFSAKDRGPAEVIELNRAIQGMVEVLNRLVGERVKLTAIPYEEPLRVRMNPAQLDQLLLNLVVNARDAMPTGGGVTIRLEPRLLGVDEAATAELTPGPYAMIRVSDNGLGMSPEVLAHAFEPFFSTKGSGRGTGLGLATVFGAAKGAGGHVWVESSEGEGTTFTVLLPITEPSPESREMAALLLPVAGLEETGSILVIEDHEEVREMMVHVLVSNGFEVFEDGDGRCRDLPEEMVAPDLAIVDLTLPYESGGLVAAQLRERWPGLKVLFTSGYRRGSDALEGVLSPTDRLLEKPFTPLELLTAVRDVLVGLPSKR